MDSDSPTEIQQGDTREYEVSDVYVRLSGCQLTKNVNGGRSEQILVEFHDVPRRCGTIRLEE
jgi:hypothetical protein